MPGPLALLAVLTFAFPIAAPAVVLSPEVPVSVPQIGNSDRALLYSSQPVASIASNGNLALAVWQERRAANQNDLFAARIDANGTVLDPKGIELTQTSSFEETARVAFNGNAFVVVWTRIDFPAGRSVWTMQIGVDGSIVHPAEHIADGLFDGLATAHGVTAVAIRPDDPYVSAAITILLIQPDGSIGRVTVGTGRDAALTATASGFGVAFWDAVTSSEFEILACRVSTTGTILSPATKFISLASFGGYAIAADADDLIVATGGADLRLLRLHDGSVQTIGTTPLSGFVWSAMYADSAIVVARTDDTASSVMRFSRGGALVESIPMQRATTVSTVTLGGRIYAIRVTYDRTANVFGGFAENGASEIVLSRCADTQLAPAIATDGEHLLIVWADLHELSASGVKAVLASLDGTPVAEPFVVFPSAYLSGSFAVAFDGERYVIVAQQYSGPNEQLYYDLVATHVSRTGVAAGDRIVISTSASVQSSPRVIASPHGVLVAWLNGYYAAPDAQYALLGGGAMAPVDLGRSDVVAAAWTGSSFITVSGQQQLNVARIGFGVTETIAGSPGLANMSSNGDGALLVYWGGTGIMALPLDRDGHRTSDPKVIRTIQSDTTRVSSLNIAWDGREYLIGWDERPIIAGYLQTFTTAYGAVVDRDGNAMTLPFALQPLAIHSSAPFPFGLGSGRSIRAFSRLASEVTGVERVFTRMLVQPARARAVRR